MAQEAPAGALHALCRQASLRTPSRLARASARRRNHLPKPAAHCPADSVHDTPIATLPADTPGLALRWATRGRTDGRRRAFSSSAHRPGTPAWRAQSVMPQLSDAVRARIHLPGTKRAEPVQTPAQAAARKTPQDLRMKSRSYLPRRLQPGLRPSCGGLLQFGGWRAVKSPSERPRPSSPPNQQLGGQRLRCHFGEIARL